jgi:hypothetical protein
MILFFSMKEEIYKWGLYILFFFFLEYGFCIVQIIGRINQVVQAGIYMCITEINHLNRLNTHLSSIDRRYIGNCTLYFNQCSIIYADTN